MPHRTCAVLERAAVTASPCWCSPRCSCCRRGPGRWSPGGRSRSRPAEWARLAGFGALAPRAARRRGVASASTCCSPCRGLARGWPEPSSAAVCGACRAASGCSSRRRGCAGALAHAASRPRWASPAGWCCVGRLGRAGGAAGALAVARPGGDGASSGSPTPPRTSPAVASAVASSPRAISPGKTWEGVVRRAGRGRALCARAGAVGAARRDSHARATLRRRARFGRGCRAAARRGLGRRRSLRIAAQAPGRRQGQRHAAAGARRRARPHRRAARGDAAGRAGRRLACRGSGRDDARAAAAGRHRLDRRFDARRRGPASGTVRGRRAAPRTATSASCATLCRRFRPQLCGAARRSTPRARSRGARGRRLPTRGAGRAGGLSREVASLAGGRHRDGGDRRRGRARPDARRGARGQAHPAREQGGAGDRRRALHGRACARGWRDAAADRQRAQRDLPVPAARLRGEPGRGGACGASCSPPPAGRSARRPLERARRGHARRGLRASQLGRWGARSRSTRPP